MSSNFYVRSLTSLQGVLSRAKSRFDQKKDACTTTELNLYLNSVRDLCDQFRTNLLELEPKDANKAKTFSIDDFEEEVMTFKVQVMELLEAKVLNNSNSNSAIKPLSETMETAIPLQMPEIKIPNFNGEFVDWIAFKELFLVMVHENKNIPVPYKFNYLRKSLSKGEAFHFIDGIQCSDANYAHVWESLINYYDDVNRSIEAHMSNIYFLKPLSNDTNPKSIREFTNNLNKQYNALKSLNVPVQYWDIFLVFHITNKVSSNLQKEIISMKCSKQNMSYADVMDILNKKLKLLESITNTSSTMKIIQNSNKITNNFKPNLTNRNSTSNPSLSKGHPSSSKIFTSNVDPTHLDITCPFCNETHSLFVCEKFKECPWTEKYPFVKGKNLCINCLYEHAGKSCKSRGCRKCGKFHHTLLHTNNYKAKIDSNSSINGNKNQQAQTTNHISACSTDANLISSLSVENEQSIPPSLNFYSGSQVLLATAIIWVDNLKGHKLVCRALLDQGSQSNFITSTLAQRLNASRERVNTPIIGINGKKSTINFQANLNITSRVSSYSVNLKCLILNQFPSMLPASTVEFEIKNLPPNIQLADPKFYMPQEVDMIIGAEIFFDLFSVPQDKIIVNELPPLINSQFGYIICGKTNGSVCKSVPQISSFCCDINELQQQVKKLFQIDEISGKNNFSLEEKMCEDHFKNNFIRNETGRYSLALPTKPNLNQLGDSFHIAVKQFELQEKRFSKNETLKNEYIKFMDEYLNLQHMSPVDFNINNSSKSYFLPHHAVFKESDNKTKIRVVFNASSKSSSGVSLNDVLMVGPTIQDDVFSLLLRFRKHPVALVADVTKMYRQILIHKDHRNLQQIVWRKSPNDPLQVFQLNTVTYGTGSAPFAAIRTLKQLSIDEVSNFPNAAAVLQNDFYVDDLVSGTASVKTAIQMKSDLTTLLSRGGFELCKWASNLEQIMDEPMTKTSVLGIPWHLTEDVFSICVGKFEIKSPVSRRTVLSQLAQIFDPMGLCAPIVFMGKLILRDIWQSTPKLKWDDEIDQNIADTWLNYIEQLNSLNNIEIPRCLLTYYSTSIELHGFGDASENGYGCCVYLRVKNKFQNYNCNLLCAKSRVTALKKHTIPRLELCAALLLAQLYDKVKNALNVSFTRVMLWSDSEITLYRINSSPSKYSTFVGNRVSKIQDLSSPSVWEHIPSKLNPADVVSRGLMPKELEDQQLWWHGPSFLSKTSDEWPIPFLKTSTKNLEDPETQKLSNFSPTNTTHFLIDKFSDYYRLLRITALVIRFVKRCKPSFSQDGETCQTGTGRFITVDEINKAKHLLIKFVQQNCFFEEIKAVKMNQTVNQNSSFKKLCPFLDKNGILRVGGRLKNSSLSFDQIHQILLPSKHCFTRLLVRYEHERNLHAGPQALLNYTRQNFWILNGRQLCRKIFHECIPCLKQKPRSIEQFMGDLPSERVNPARPFSIVGVDFGGPFITRQINRSKITHKVYISLFVCFATKAVHLEMVSDLSTSAFIAALKRFISRRGRCSHIFSDNATNFTGARKELDNLHSLFTSELHNYEITKYLTEEGINWHNIPAQSPHFGGLWEAAIKSAKFHLKRAVGSHICTQEELLTLIVQIEACLNSRPISTMSNDPSDLSPLTPGHFLIGAPINALPEPTLLHLNFNRLDRFQQIQYCLQTFWRRWSLEYLNELQVRHKWLKTNKEIQVGKIVLLKDNNLPPMKWTTGRIVDVHYGNDGLIRVVTVQTASGLYKRALNRVCPLPINGNTDDEIVKTAIANNTTPKEKFDSKS